MRAAAALLVLLVPLAASGQITFERTYGGLHDDVGESVYQTRDGGYIIAGRTESFGAGAEDVYLVGIDRFGDTLWTRTYGGSSRDYGRSVRQTADGGYIITGHTRSFGAGNDDVYLIKTDAAGDTVWRRTYGGLGWEWGYSVAQTDDGGYIIAGYSSPFGISGCDVYLVKTDALGDTLWTREYGDSEDEWGCCVEQTEDGGYIIAGYTTSFGAGLTDVYLVSTDSLGDTLWTRTYGGPQHERAYSVAQTDDGGYIIVGETNSFGVCVQDVYLIKTDAVGDTAWTRTYGGDASDHGHSVAQTVDGGYIVTGSTASFGWVDYDAYLVKTDALGGTIWTRIYGGTDDDWAYSVVQTDDGGYVIAGGTYSFGAGVADVYSVKTNAEGLVQVSGQREERLGPEYRYLAQNYPNPFATSTTINYALAVAERVTVTVYDIRGAFVRNLVSGTLPAGRHEVVWDGRDERGARVGSGIYFCRLAAGEQSETRRMVLLH